MFVKPLTAFPCIAALAASSLFAAHAAAAAESFQPLTEVRAAAESALRVELATVPGLTLTAAPLDDRLRLPRCERGLDALASTPRSTQPSVVVRVTCAGAGAWSINVPVKITRRIPVLVLRRAAGRGETLQATDVSVESRQVNGLVSPFVARVEDLAGRLTRRPLAQGTPVPAEALGAALVVRRGQNVTLTAFFNGIEVRAPGIALADAAVEQRVRVQNAYSLKVVEGIAENGGLVRVSR